MPASLYRRVNKRAIRSRLVEIVAVLWDRSRWYCKRCGMAPAGT